MVGSTSSRVFDERYPHVAGDALVLGATDLFSYGRMLFKVAPQLEGGAVRAAAIGRRLLRPQAEGSAAAEVREALQKLLIEL